MNFCQVIIMAALPGHLKEMMAEDVAEKMGSRAEDVVFAATLEAALEVI